ncbi:MAG TPA: hypothetical protein VF432_17535 [Thermoanaerobaculia bacterium]
MKKSLAVMAMLTALLAAGCMSSSHSMMMSDRSMMASDGTMSMRNSDGTSRPMTEQEMSDHMAMMSSDPRYSAMMMERCKSTGTMASSSDMSSSSTSGSSGMSGMSSGTKMMVMNSDGTSSRAMTDAEYRMHMDRLAKNSQMSRMMMSKCGGM